MPHPHLNPIKPVNVKGKHFPAEFRRLSSVRYYRVRLVKGQTARLPGTTKKLLHGPASIVYTVWPDGGIDGFIE